MRGAFHRSAGRGRGGKGERKKRGEKKTAARRKGKHFPGYGHPSGCKPAAPGGGHFSGQAVFPVPDLFPHPSARRAAAGGDAAQTRKQAKTQKSKRVKKQKKSADRQVRALLFSAKTPHRRLRPS